MAVTIKDIAKKANVSRGTVDRALNGRSGVSKEVAERIRQIAEELGYKPNTVAKALATHAKPCCIGIVINNVGNPFFDEVLQGILAARDEISDFGITVNLRSLGGYDPAKQLELVRELYYEGLDALAITPVSDPMIRDYLNELIADGVKVVCFNMDIEDVDYLAYVGCDYYRSGQTSGWMIGLATGGKADLGIVTGSRELYSHELRVKGCTSVLEKEYPGVKLCDIIEVEDNEEVSYERAMQLLTEHKDIDALYYVCAGTAGGLRAIHELGLEKKLRIFTFDTTPTVLDGLRSGDIIATVDQQPFEQGYMSVKLLFDALLNNQMPAKKKYYTELNIKSKYNI